MKILFINVVYGKGSTGKIVQSLFNESSKNHKTYLIYGRGKKVEEKNIFKLTCELESKIHHLISKFTGNMYGGMFFSTRRIIKKIKELKPDVVNLHCLNGYFVNIYSLLKWLAKNNIKTVLTAHADFMMTGGCGIAGECNKYLTCNCRNCKNVHSFNGAISLNRTRHFFNKMNESISLFKDKNFCVTTVSPWLEERYKNSPIYRKYSVTSIMNPVDETFFKIGSKNPYIHDKNVLFVTPDIFDVLKCASLVKPIAQQRKDIHFTVICTKNQEYDFNEENITYIKGGVPKELLRDYYYFADGTLLLSTRETFSMVTAESLCTGTPVYGFECGGPESISNPDDTCFIKGRNIAELSEKLLTIERNKMTIQNNAKNSFDEKNVFDQYLKAFSSLLLII